MVCRRMGGSSVISPQIGSGSEVPVATAQLVQAIAPVAAMPMAVPVAQGHMVTGQPMMMDGQLQVVAGQPVGQSTESDAPDWVQARGRVVIEGEFIIPGAPPGGWVVRER